MSTSLGLALKLLEDGRRIEVEVGGMSMAPLLRLGDRIVVGPVLERELSVGDVAVFRTEGRLLAHRVVALAPLRTRGDDVDVAAIDPPWPDGALVGRVVAVRFGYDGRLVPMTSWEGKWRSRWSASPTVRRLRNALRSTSVSSTKP